MLSEFPFYLHFFPHRKRFQLLRFFFPSSLKFSCFKILFLTCQILTGFSRLSHKMLFNINNLYALGHQAASALRFWAFLQNRIHYLLTIHQAHCFTYSGLFSPPFNSVRQNKANRVSLSPGSSGLLNYFFFPPSGKYGVDT